MANIVFVTWDGGGNVPPAVGIAVEMQRRGDTVQFLGHEQQRATIEAAGLRFEPYSRGPGRWSSTAPKVGTVGMFASLSAIGANSLGEDLISIVRRGPADLVVIDCVLRGVLRKAAQAEFRRAVLVHSFFGMARFTMGTGPIARLRGRATTGPWGGADLGLVATLRDLDPDGRGDLPSIIRYTGPVWQGHPRPSIRNPGKPRVLVSLSTVWFPRQVKVLQNILDSLRGANLEAIVTTGPAVDPSELRAPANATLHRYLPHAEIMPTVELVIGHGGHATTMAALAHDIPMIILPMHRVTDQPIIGRAVQAAGAGRVLAKMSPPQCIRRTIDELLHDGPHRTAAARLGAEIRRRDGASVAADHLAEVLALSE
jgi:UDP:flavonoid glycosyltransferase YjiC (YdhE family)